MTTPDVLRKIESARVIKDQIGETVLKQIGATNFRVYPVFNSTLQKLKVKCGVRFDVTPNSANICRVGVALTMNDLYNLYLINAETGMVSEIGGLTFRELPECLLQTLKK